MNKNIMTSTNKLFLKIQYFAVFYSFIYFFSDFNENINDKNNDSTCFVNVPRQRSSSRCYGNHTQMAQLLFVL